MSLPVSLEELEKIANYYMTHTYAETAKKFKRSTSVVHRAATTYGIKKYDVSEREPSEEKLGAQHSTAEVPYNIDQRLWTPPPSAAKYEVTRCLR